MKKRLLYAMPRVPLQQLKEQQRKEHPDNTNEEVKQNLVCKLRAQWRKLSEAVVKRSRKNQELIYQNVEEDKKQEGQNEAQLNDTMSAIITEPINDNNAGFEIDVEPADRKMPLNIKEEAMKAMRNAEIMLQKDNRGRKVRVVVVESDSEKEENLHNNRVEDNRGLADTEESCSNQEEHFTVQADVHHDEQGAARIWTNIANDSTNTEKPGNFGGARPKQKMRNPRRHESRLLKGSRQKGNGKNINIENGNKDGKSDGLQKKRHHRDKQEKQQNEVHWGLDETSESDGGWDCDDIPLLPM